MQLQQRLHQETGIINLWTNVTNERRAGLCT